MQYRVCERELNDLRDKLLNANRSLTSANGNISSQETLICQLRGELLPFYSYARKVKNPDRFWLNQYFRGPEVQRGKNTKGTKRTPPPSRIVSYSSEHSE